jgi:hypothetical protein
VGSIVAQRFIWTGNQWIRTDVEAPLALFAVSTAHLFMATGGVNGLTITLGVTNFSGSGSIVASNSPAIASPLLTGSPTSVNAINHSTSTISGVGGANTNFTADAADDVVYINAGTTNVHITAIMGGTSSLASYKLYILTNLTTTARELSVSSVTNRWVGLQQYDGISFPITVTNKHTGFLSVMLDGTNTFWAFKQATNGF